MSLRMCLLLGSAALIVSGAAATSAVSQEHRFTERLNRAQLEYRVMPPGNPHHRVVWVRRWIWDNFWGDYHIVWMPRITTYRTVSYTPHRRRTHMAAISDVSGDNAPSKSSDKGNTDSKTASADSHSASSGPDTARPDKNTAIASVEPMARPQPPANSHNNAKLVSVDTHAEPTAEKPDKDTKTASADTSSAKPAETTEKPAPKVSADLTKPVTPAEIRSAVPLAKIADPKQTLASVPIKSVWGDTLGKVRGVDVNGGNLKTVDAQLGGKNVVKMDPSHLKYVKSRGLVITTLSKEDAAKLPKANAL